MRQVSTAWRSLNELVETSDNVANGQREQQHHERQWQRQQQQCHNELRGHHLPSSLVCFSSLLSYIFFTESPPVYVQRRAQQRRKQRPHPLTYTPPLTTGKSLADMTRKRNGGTQRVGTREQQWGKASTAREGLRSNSPQTHMYVFSSPCLFFTNFMLFLNNRDSTRQPKEHQPKWDTRGRP